MPPRGWNVSSSVPLSRPAASLATTCACTFEPLYVHVVSTPLLRPRYVPLQLAESVAARVTVSPRCFASRNAARGMSKPIVPCHR